jgi:hypothetical protein
MTMKASFSLTNLSFDTSDFSKNLFTIDEEYMKVKMEQNHNLFFRNSESLIPLLNQNFQNPKAAAHTLNEIYKLCKTDEDYEEDDEDSESLERAQDLFNSMLKK